MCENVDPENVSRVCTVSTHGVVSQDHHKTPGQSDGAELSGKFKAEVRNLRSKIITGGLQAEYDDYSYRTGPSNVTFGKHHCKTKQKNHC